MGFQKVALDHIQSILQAALITNIPKTDKARAGIVKVGQLQETMDPDTARISVTIFENDPDQFVSGIPTSMSGKGWVDEIVEVEIGGCVTWRRCFTVKARCLFEQTRETEALAETYASTVRGRIEKAILNSSWRTVVDGTTYVARGPISLDFQAEQMKAGGPPDSFDYLIKIHFAVLTSETVLV